MQKFIFPYKKNQNFMDDVRVKKIWVDARVPPLALTTCTISQKKDMHHASTRTCMQNMANTIFMRNSMQT